MRTQMVFTFVYYILVRIHLNGTISTSRKNPRLQRMKLNRKHPKIIFLFVILKPFQWHNQWILQQITERKKSNKFEQIKSRNSLINHPMRHDHTPVVRSRGEERIPLVEGNVTYRTSMQSQRLVRFRAQIQVEPERLAIVSTYYEIVSAWMNSHRRDPLGIRHQLLYNRLLH